MNSRLVVASIAPDQKWMATDALAKSRQTSAEEMALVFACSTDLLGGDYEGVEQICGRAIVLGPSNPVPHKLLGVALLIEKRYERSVYEFGQAVQLAPTDPGSRVGLGEALRGLDDYDGSINAFTTALTLLPRDPGIWNARCWTRGLFAKDLKAGLQDCNEALRLSPISANALDSRGLIYLRLGNLDVAIRNYDAALAVNADLTTALYGRGAARVRLGLLQGGQGDIAWARSLDKNVDDVFYRAPLLSRGCLASLFTQMARSRCAGIGPAPQSRLSNGRLSSVVDAVGNRDVKRAFEPGIF